MSYFPCSLTRNITSHSVENLAFHSLLRWKMIILPLLTTSLIHFSLKGLENVLFDIGCERVQKHKGGHVQSTDKRKWSDCNYHGYDGHRLKMIILPILTTSLIRFSVWGLKNVLFELPVWTSKSADCRKNNYTRERTKIRGKKQSITLTVLRQTGHRPVTETRMVTLSIIAIPSLSKRPFLASQT